MRNFADGINPALAENPIDRRNLAVIKAALREQSRAIAKIVPSGNNPVESITTVNNTTTILGGQTQHIWHANGPYQIGTEIDGGIVSPTTATISAIRIHRTTPGTSGSTTLDINRNGTTLYITNPSSKPSLAFGDAVLNATLPSDINISLGDILTLDIDGIEVGNPANLTVVMGLGVA